MKKELENKLVKKYPEFFEYLKDHEGPIMPMAFGFECGDGWYFILDNLMGEIQNTIKNSEEWPEEEIKSKFWRYVVNKIEKKLRYKSHKWKKTWKLFTKFKKKLKIVKSEPLKVQAHQIKEKFGGLRFYIGTTGGRRRDHDEVYGMISLAESMSYGTCELCGTTKNVGHTQGWITTCCKKCFDEGKLNTKVWNPIKE